MFSILNNNLLYFSDIFSSMNWLVYFQVPLLQYIAFISDITLSNKTIELYPLSS